MCHRLRHHTVSRLPRSRRRWKPVLAACIKGLNMPFFDLSGFSSRALLLVLLIYATHRLITSSNFRPSKRRLSVFFISCRFLESREPSGAGEMRRAGKKMCRTSSHLLSDVAPEVWCKCTNCHDCECIWNLITFHTLGLCPPRTSHTIRKTYDAPSFPPLMKSW